LKCFSFKTFLCLPLLFRSVRVSGVRRPGNTLLLCAQETSFALFRVSRRCACSDHGYSFEMPNTLHSTIN
jgi:hypothetical protein